MNLCSLRLRRILAMAAFAFIAIAGAPGLFGAEFDHEHSRLSRILGSHVRNGQVDYAGLKAAPTDLAAYLDDLAAIRPDEFQGWPQPRRLACLINLYNAATLQLVVDHYPVTSIKKIGGTFSSPWKQSVVRWGGKTITLDDLEHSIIRAEYQEPRCHFALVCAAKSCPPLRSEAYSGARLDEQLADQGRLFLAQPDKNRVDAAKKTLWLSPIFKWFEGDFSKAGGSVTGLVRTLVLPEQATLLGEGSWKIRYTDYDWSLNSR